MTSEEKQKLLRRGTRSVVRALDHHCSYPTVIQGNELILVPTTYLKRCLRADGSSWGGRRLKAYITPLFDMHPVGAMSTVLFQEEEVRPEELISIGFDPLARIPDEVDSRIRRWLNQDAEPFFREYGNDRGYRDLLHKKTYDGRRGLIGKVFDHVLSTHDICDELCFSILYDDRRRIVSAPTRCVEYFRHYSKTQFREFEKANYEFIVNLSRLYEESPTEAKFEVMSRVQRLKERLRLH